MNESSAIGKQLLALLDRVENTIRSARNWPPERATKALMDLIAALRACPGVESSDHACHALGYCWYTLPGESEERLAETEKWLRRALELNPAHHFARVLLGHHYYDQSIYGAAKHEFLAIPEDFFRRYDQVWRDLKIRELIVCCDVYRYPERLTAEQVAPVFETYIQGPADELVIPFEIVQAVVWASLSVPACPGVAGAARECLAMIDRLDLADKFGDAVRVLRPVVVQT